MMREGRTTQPIHPDGRIKQLAAAVAAALLIVLAAFGAFMSLIMAAFSEGRREPWRSSPMIVLAFGVVFAVACLIAAVGMIRRRRWGVLLGLGAVAIAVVGAVLLSQ